MKALALIIVFIAATVQANQCLDVFKQQPLTASQKFWLNVAENTDYSVTRLRSRDGQYVIVLGEAHLKNIDASLVGKRLLLEFPYRAHELFNPEKTWGGEFFAVYLDSVFNYIRTTSNRAYPSTIHDAHATRNQGLSSVKQLEELLAKTYNEQNQEIKKDYFLEKQQHDYKNFFLETNHKPDLKENLYSVIVPTEFAAKFFLIPSVTIALVAPNSFISETVVPGFLLIIGLRAIHKYIGKKLKNKNSNKSWYNNIFFDDQGVIDARNQTKSKNINKILSENKDVQTLLVIVGRLHVPGIVENLKNMGYKEQQNNQLD